MYIRILLLRALSSHHSKYVELMYVQTYIPRYVFTGHAEYMCSRY